MILLCLTILLFLAWYYKRTRAMSLLKQGGVPGPKPNLILGNVLQMRNMSAVDYQKVLFKTYGKVVGYYIGAQPTVLVTDLELIKNIQINDFKSFAQRPETDMGFVFYHKQYDRTVPISKGETWKNIRSLLSPSFSPSKLKAMTPLIEDSVNTFLDIIGRYAETGEEFNFYPMSERLTAETIIKSAFGIENKIQNNSENKLFEDINEYLSVPISKTLYLLVNCFPWLFPVIFRLRRLDIFTRNSNIARLSKTIYQMIKLRKESPELGRDDIMKVLIDSKIDDIEKEQDYNLFVEERTRSISHSTSFSKRGKPIKLSDNDIIGNALVIYIGGYDTISITLASTAHHLVNFPDVQEKVRREVQELYESKGRLDFTDVMSGLQYLEYVINETLRMYPPIDSLISRQCLQDYKYEDMTIPKGATILIPSIGLHYDPDYWPNPEVFDPMRFSPERKHEIIPSSYQAFGDGPRTCLGTRLAYLEMKLVFAKLLLHYRLEKGPNTEIGRLSTELGYNALRPKCGVHVKVAKI